MSKSHKFLPNQNGASANTIVIEGAMNPTEGKSIVLPIKVNEEGSICITDEAEIDNGFDIMTTGSYKTSDLGTRWDALKAISGSSAEFKASSSVADDLCSTGVFSTGGNIYADRGDVFYGEFVEVSIDAGMLMAYRTEYTEYDPLYSTDGDEFYTVDGDLLLVK